MAMQQTFAKNSITSIMCTEWENCFVIQLTNTVYNGVKTNTNFQWQCKIHQLSTELIRNQRPLRYCVLQLEC